MGTDSIGLTSRLLGLPTPRGFGTDLQVERVTLYVLAEDALALPCLTHPSGWHSCLLWENSLEMGNKMRRKIVRQATVWG